ncbi:MAG: sigma factor-like helix-turn-helix DNA-binding protein [Sphingopyxis sp.]
MNSHWRQVFEAEITMDIRVNAPDWPNYHGNIGSMRLDPVIIAQSLVRFADAAVVFPVASQNPVEHLWIQAKGAALLAQAIMSLSEREILVLHLTFVARLSLSEAAHVLELGERRVRFVKKQALTRLYGQMGHQYFKSV